MNRVRVRAVTERPGAQTGGPGGLIGVNTTVVPNVLTRVGGPGGLIEMIAMLGNPRRFGLGGLNVSMTTRPPAVSTVVRA